MFFRIIHHAPFCIFLALGFLICMSPASSWPQPSSGQNTVSIQLAWKHQFQFAGYYAALAQGYYQEAGLDVQLIQGGAGRFAREAVLSGQAQYGVAGAELLLHRLDGDPFVVLAPIFQHSPSILLFRADSGITHPQDLIGKRVMLLPGKKDADILAVFLNEDIGLDAFRRLDQTYNLDDLVEGRTDAVSAYLTNEPWHLQQLGVEPGMIRPQTYGIDFYSDCLFTTQQEIDDHPERVEKVLQASLKGWHYAMDHPQEMIEWILSQYQVSKSREHLRYEAQSMQELILPELVEIGHMNPGRWRHIADTYGQLGMIEADFSLDGFLYAPNRDADLGWLKWLLGIALGISLLLVCGALIIMVYNRRLKAEIREGKQARLINETLYQIANAVNTTQNLNELYAKIHESLARIIELPNLFIALYHKAENKITFPYYVDEYDSEVQRIEDITKSNSLTGEVILARHPLFLTETMLTERAEAQRIVGITPKIWLGIPLLVKGEVIGVVAVQHYSNPEHFQKRDLDLLVAVSDQIAVAIEWKRADEAVRESEEQYRELVQSANSIILRTDLQGRIHFLNAFGQQLLGYSRQELCGRKVTETIVPETESQGRDLQEVMIDLYANPHKYANFENENVCRDGRRIWVLWTNKVVRNSQGEMQELLSIGHDITEKKELEKQLNQAQKIEALGTLTGGIAHDFNNILGIILGYTEIAQVKLEAAHPVQESLNEVKAASLRARDIVSQLLAFTRKGEQKRQVLDIRPMVKEGLKMLRSTLPASIAFQVSIADDLPNVLTDATQIHQILVNLCTNAFHAMEAGGELGVSLEKAVVHGLDTSFGTNLAPGEYLKLSVSDTGQGIARENLERIFDPYFTTKEVDKGSGLGLSVVLGIVKGHHGGVKVRSQLGRGTLFEIFLPAARDQASKPDGAAPFEEVPRGSERILFVDDEDMIVDLNRQRLENLGYSITGITDPEEALALFRQDPDRFDLVITDMTMSKMNGDVLSQKIFAIRPEMPIILCTGHSESISRDSAKGLGLAEFLEKPLGRQTLACAVRNVLDTRGSIQ